MSLEDQARARGLTDQANAVWLEDYHIVEELMTLQDEDMKDVNIKKGQKGLLRVDELNAPSQAVSNTSTPSNTGSDAGSSDSMPSGRTDKSRGFSKLPTEDDYTLGLHDETIKDIQKHIEEHGVKDARKILNEKLKKYEETPVHIAVIGRSGAGKSSFINTMRNMTPKSTCAAQVGTVETTMKRQPYPDPENTNLVYWDLPGIGGPPDNFKREEYPQKVRLKEYDFFLLLSESRVSEDDLYLAKEVHHRKKHFFFVRTKIDQDLDSEENDNPTNDDPDGVVNEIRDKCIAKLNKAGLPASNTFVISTRLKKRGQFDFPRLIKMIISNAPSEKKASLILAMTACSEEVIEAKREELKGRIHSVATGASLRESVIDSQQDFIIEEIKLYARQFGLTKTDMRNMGVNVVTKKENIEAGLGILGSFIVNVDRVAMNVVSFPAKFVKILTGHLEEDRKAIAKELLKVLNKCAEAAKELIKLERHQ